MPAPRSRSRSTRRDRQPAARRPRRSGGGWGPRLAVVGVLAVVIGGAFAALAYAASTSDGRAPKGATVAGVAIGGLTQDAAIAKLQQQIGKPATRPVRVQVGGSTYKLTAKTAKITMDLQQAVDRAIDNGSEGSFVERGWHKITGSTTGTAQPVTVDVDRQAVRDFVDRIAEGVEEPARDAALDIQLTSVSVTKSKTGTELEDPNGLVTRVVRKIRSRGTNRLLDAETETVEPSVTTDALLEKTPTVVTVDKSSTTVRVFKGGKLDKTYSVAIGSNEYPTPDGQFSVQTMQVNPTWNVPQSDWAGDLAGQSIPGGDPRNPLKARWIGFNGSVGFHGTGDAGSIGSAASHGCVRMNPSDVIDLYERVAVGTPVLVA